MTIDLSKGPWAQIFQSAMVEKAVRHNGHLMIARDAFAKVLNDVLSEIDQRYRSESIDGGERIEPLSPNENKVFQRVAVVGGIEASIDGSTLIAVEDAKRIAYGLIWTRASGIASGPVDIDVFNLMDNRDFLHPSLDDANKRYEVVVLSAIPGFDVEASASRAYSGTPITPLSVSPDHTVDRWQQAIDGSGAMIVIGDTELSMLSATSILGRNPAWMTMDGSAESGIAEFYSGKMDIAIRTAGIDHNAQQRAGLSSTVLAGKIVLAP